MTPGQRSVRLRLVTAGVLAAAVLGLLIVGRTAGTGNGHTGVKPDVLDPLIDSLLSDYGLTEKKVRTTTIRTAGGTPIRVERKAKVPGGFLSLEFNRDLARSVRPYGGSVVGTERSREQTVILHVVLGELTVQSVYLQTEDDE